MELRGSLGGSVRLFLQRDAVDGGEIGSEPRRVSSTGAIVAPLVARPSSRAKASKYACSMARDTPAGTSILLPDWRVHVMKMMAHRHQRRTSLGVALGSAPRARPQRFAGVLASPQ